MIRIVIADDHAIFREGVKRIIDSTSDIQVVTEASDGNAVMRTVREFKFDVLLMDMSMPGRNGVELIKWVRLHAPVLRILVLSMHEELQYAVRAIKAGASGYLTKESAPNLLVDALRKVAGGGAYISSEIAQQLVLGAIAGQEAKPHENLTDREFSVFLLLAVGASNSEVAEKLGISVKTVSTHKANLMQKMGLQNQSYLIRYAMRHELIDQS